MDSGAHTGMERLIQRASPEGSLGHRSSYYQRDGTYDPPPSPTAKWKGAVHAYVAPTKDPNRFPYLPHPYPLKKRGRAHPGNGGHPGGFMSLQPPQQPVKYPDEDLVYMTYSEWWHAQRPTDALPGDKDSTFSTSYWPYGRRLSCVASMDKDDQFYNLDKRLVKNHTFYKDRRAPLSESWRSMSSSQLLGSHTEHFGFDRSLGKKTSSHAGAAHHEQKRLGLPDGKQAGRRTMWDSVTQPSFSPPPLQRASSAPMEVLAGNSRYDPKQSTRNLGLGSRTHAEWCLPQPPAYSVH